MTAGSGVAALYDPVVRRDYRTGNDLMTFRVFWGRKQILNKLASAVLDLFKLFMTVNAYLVFQAHC